MSEPYAGICTTEDFHPYECSGKPCRHCERRDDAFHDPGLCALCDPEYDFQPNPYWEQRREMREEMWTELDAMMEQS